MLDSVSFTVVNATPADTTEHSTTAPASFPHRPAGRAEGSSMGGGGGGGANGVPKSAAGRLGDLRSELGGGTWNVS